MIRHYRKRRVKRRYTGRRSLIRSNRVTPQYILKPRLTTHRPVNVPFSSNFRQMYFSQTGSGRKRHHKKRKYHSYGIQHFRKRRHVGYRRRGGVHKPMSRVQKINQAGRSLGNRIISFFNRERGNRRERQRIESVYMYHPEEIIRSDSRRRSSSSRVRPMGTGRRGHGIVGYARRRYHKRRGGKKPSLLGELHHIAKKHKFLSRGLNYVAKNGPGFISDYAKTAHDYAKAHGYGRRHRNRVKHRKHHKHRIHGGFRHLGVIHDGAGRHRRRRHGRGFFDFLKNAHDYIKNNKVISKGLRSFAPLFGTYAPAALAGGEFADKLGYGRRHRRHRGKGIGKVGGLFTTPIHAGYHGGSRHRIHHIRHRMHGKGTPFPFVDSDAVKGKMLSF